MIDFIIYGMLGSLTVMAMTYAVKFLLSVIFAKEVAIPLIIAISLYFYFFKVRGKIKKVAGRILLLFNLFLLLISFSGEISSSIRKYTKDIRGGETIVNVVDKVDDTIREKKKKTFDEIEKKFDLKKKTDINFLNVMSTFISLFK